MTTEAQNAFPWRLSDQDVAHLAGILDIPPEKITVREMFADKEAPCCKNCGRQLGLLDYVKTSFDGGVHNTHFMETFFGGGNMSEVATPSQMEKVRSVEHSVFCYDCGEFHSIGAKWTINPMW